MHSENTCNYVVEFPDEMADGTTPMSIISNTWVSQHEDQLYCVWPKWHQICKGIKWLVKHKLPSKNTSLNRVKIIYKSNTYEKVSNKMKELEEKSSVSQSEAEDLKIKRAVKRKTYPSYADFSTSDSEGSDVPNRSSRVNSASGTICNCCKKNEAMFTKLLQLINDLRDEVRRQNKNIDEKYDDEDLNFLPFTTVQQLENFNANLMDDDKKMPQVCLVLSSIGGRDTIDTTRRLMQKITTNQLALIYNWSGRNETVRKNRLCKDATQTQIEDIIKTWLRNAPDREGGRNKRRRLV